MTLPKVAAKSVRHSGLQLQVLSLYRSILREAMGKDGGAKLQSYTVAREQFREHSNSVKRMDFQQIEYLIRKGHKKLKLLQMPGVTSVGLSTPSRE
jgi:succinate dehydrogenase assembly factor 1